MTALTPAELDHLSWSGAIDCFAALFLTLMAVANIVIWINNLRKCIKSGKGYFNQAFHLLVCGFLVFLALLAAGNTRLILRDRRSGQACLFESTVADHRIAKGKSWAYFLEFASPAPVSELEVSKSNYDALAVGDPVTVSFAPFSRTVFEVNGRKNY